MSIRKLFFMICILFCGACASDIFNEHNGNIPAPDKIAQIHQGQTKEEVYGILGAPSMVTGLSPDHWVYMSSTVRRVAFLSPKELDRQVLALSFNDNILSKIEKFDLTDGNKIVIDKDETKSTERNLGFFRKYFGGVGEYMPFGGQNTKEP